MSGLFETAGLLWVRVFAFIAAGYALGRFTPAGRAGFVRRVTDATVFVVVPVYVLAVVWEASLRGESLPRLAAAVLGVLAGCAALAAGVARRRKEPFREICLPIVFMNSIYLALPVNVILFGPQAAAPTVVFNVIVTAVHFSLGVWWVRRPGRRMWAEVFGMPVLWAMLAGAALNAGGLPMPAGVKAFASGLTRAVFPVMLVFVGLRTAGATARVGRTVAWGLAARMGGGAALGFLLAAALGLEGVERNVVVLTSSMPAAVNSYLLAERFESGPAFAAAMVSAGIAVSAFTAPLLGWMLK